MLRISTKRRLAAFLPATFAAAALVLTSGTALAGDATQAVLAAHDGFYAALNRMFQGDIQPMRAVWSHAADATYMGPTGQFEIGWDAISRDWDGQAAAKLGGTARPTQIHAVVGDSVAVVSNYEEGENTNAAGKVEKLKLRATSMYRLEDGQWKMVGHHTDTLPYLAVK